MRAALFVLQTLSAAIMFPLLATASDHHERSQQCKMAVMTETREFEAVPMAAFSLNGHHHHNLLWTIHWDGQTATGSCKYHDGHFKGVEVNNHLQHSHKQKKSDHYKGKYGGFYYDRHVGQWRDPEGEICHTCTPENGFPARGG
ncbi:MAG: hypothetical protein V7720_15190 [Halioglobus sp.]